MTLPNTITVRMVLSEGKWSRTYEGTVRGIDLPNKSKVIK